MGTSSSGGGAGGGNPLLPSWIPGMAPPSPPPLDTDALGQPDNDGPEQPELPADAPPAPQNAPNPNSPINQPLPNTNRYRQPRIDFNKFVRSGGTDSQALKSALRGYSRHAAGNTQNLAKRMRPSAGRVTDFFNAINGIKDSGLTTALTAFSLSSYINKPLFETLAALSDEIFKERGELYENTQDDSITKLAYANTVTRICDVDGIDLSNLTDNQVEVMMAIFIEETIAQRVICDIGNKLTELEHDIDTLLEIENNAYQIISGLVRTQIMPEIIVTQRGDRIDIDQKIENIYRVAFDSLGGINN
ncbi:MAG: hypothetical protein JWR09_2449 [Mucilaginibacter sp.]|nr:hypothetical protein [Mucilaginibacter sp.]